MKPIKYPRPNHAIDTFIYVVRGQRVILDSDLAEIYGVSTVRFNQAVKRNEFRFPVDSRFRLTSEEWNVLQSLRSQNVILKPVHQARRSSDKRGRHRKYLPFVFTEHGALMAANVLKSHRAVVMSVYVIRAFIRLRDALAMHKDLAQKLADLERKVQLHDSNLQEIIRALRQLMAPTQAPRRQIGFKVEEPKAVYTVNKIQRIR